MVLFMNSGSLNKKSLFSLISPKKTEHEETYFIEILEIYILFTLLLYITTLLLSNLFLVLLNYANQMYYLIIL